MKGILAILGKGKPFAKTSRDDEPSGEDMDEEETDDSGGDAREASDLAFEALKADDKDGFFDALKSFVKAC